MIIELVILEMETIPSNLEEMPIPLLAGLAFH